VAGPQTDAGQAAELDFIEGRLAHTRQDVETAERLLRQAVEAYARIGAAMEAATASLALGDLLAQDGRIREAADAYRRGLVAGATSVSAGAERSDPEGLRSDGD
jgi:tetratricopeptide (TPR) repeat protein